MKRTLCLLLAAMLLLCGCQGKTPGADSSNPAASAPVTESGTAAPGSEPESRPSELEPSEPETAAPTEPEQTCVSMYDLRVAMLAAERELPEMMSVSSADENAAELFTYLADLDYEKVEGYFLSYDSTGREGCEIAVVALKDASDLPALRTKLLEHLAGRKEMYKNYAPELVSRAENTRLVADGRYMALIMCQDQDAVEAAFHAGVN